MYDFKTFVAMMQKKREEFGITPDTIVDKMTEYYRQVDGVWQEIESKLEASGKVCRCRKGCCGCCQDDLTVTQLEAMMIRKKYPEVLEEAAGAEGRCAFLDEQGACRIYEARPVKCRTFGIPVALKGEDEKRIYGCCEERKDIDISQLSEDEILDPELMDMKLGLFEYMMYGKLCRIELRSLFKK